MPISDQRISWFQDSAVQEIAPPARFTFPFYYEPHALTRVAAAELQAYLETLTELDHNFGLDRDKEGLVIGKMFGVLVVRAGDGRLGYLSAFSGKLAGTNDHPLFVPPVFDMLVAGSFFLKEQEQIDAINRQLEAQEADVAHHSQKLQLQQLTAQAAQEIAALKQQLKINKELRAQHREEGKNTLGEEAYAIAEADLAKQSHYDRHCLRELTATWKQRIADISATVAAHDTHVEALKNERRERSGALQQQLFEQYSFLNKTGKSKSLHDIFVVTAFGRPPAGAGECATPKLLQYAFAHGYEPLAMAEFWWGAAPKSEIRKHKEFYPACAGKCKPILAHMLEGIPLDDNPFLQPAAPGATLQIVYEDEYLLVVNKPEGLRSVPGVDIDESVYSRLKAMLPVEPLMVHRLDMGTSGLLVVAKTHGAHKHLQKQFLARTISKRYTALLSKVITAEEGEISLPLVADPFNRPRQLVCFDTGKTSITKWKAVATTATTTRVHFWPLTGRTHQLRMHAAHELGLDAPIVGDDLYGTAAERLYLHAAHLSFIHPVTKQQLSFEVAEEF